MAVFGRLVLKGMSGGECVAGEEKKEKFHGGLDSVEHKENLAHDANDCVKKKNMGEKQQALPIQHTAAHTVSNFHFPHVLFIIM